MLIAIFPVYAVYWLIAVGVSAVTTMGWYALALPAWSFFSIAETLALHAVGWDGETRAEQADQKGRVTYFYGPATADFGTALLNCLERGQNLVEKNLKWAWAKVKPRDQAPSADRHRELQPLWPSSLTWRPVGVGWFAGLVPGLAAGALLSLPVVLAYVLTMSLAIGLTRTAGRALRWTDSGLLWARNRRMTCPNSDCFAEPPGAETGAARRVIARRQRGRIKYPNYKCPRLGCEREATDVRAGRYGLLRYTCTCGEQIPTLLLRRTGRLDAYCQRGHPLPYRPGTAPEIVLPFIGGTAAGKTQLMSAVTLLLRSAPGLDARFADKDTRDAALAVANHLKSGIKLPTTVDERPKAWLLRLGAGRSARLLQLFDASGVAFSESERISKLGYLWHAATFVVVVDPLAIPDLWLGLSAGRRQEFLEFQSAERSPDAAYQRTGRQLAKDGAKLSKARLAVVISRADLLDWPGGRDPEEWAISELGLGNLIRSARARFGGGVKVFLTGSVPDGFGQLDPSVVTFAEWVLGPAGFPQISRYSQPLEIDDRPDYHDEDPALPELAPERAADYRYQSARLLTLGLSTLVLIMIVDVAVRVLLRI